MEIGKVIEVGERRIEIPDFNPERSEPRQEPAQPMVKPEKVREDA